MGERQSVGIGEAARILGTTERTLRFYEQRGVLAPSGRHRGAHRRYDPAELETARQVLSLRRLGLDLDTIRSLLADEDVDLAGALEDQAGRLDARIGELEELRHRLRSLASEAPGRGRTKRSVDLLKEVSMRIVLSTIRTQTGDTGSTSIGRNVRIDKRDPQLEVIGDVDELVSALGVAIAAGAGRQDREIRRLQNELFDLGADLASPDEDAPRRITGAHVARLEELCDEVNATLVPPTSFVLPGTGAASAALHHARAICRRAERHAWASAGTGDDARRYLNRLSDVLFVLARAAASGEEPTWEAVEPASSR